MDRKEWLEAQSHEKWYWENQINWQDDLFFERTEYYYNIFEKYFRKKYNIAIEVWCWPVWLLKHINANQKIWIDPLINEYIRMWYDYQRKGISTINWKWESIILKSNISDITISVNAIDHADNPIKVIKEMVRVTKLNWIIIINTDLRERFSQTDMFHINILSEKEILKAIKWECKIIDISYLEPRVVTMWVEKTSWSINIVLKKIKRSK